MAKNFQETLEEAYTSGKLTQILDTSKTLADIAIALGYSAHGRNTGSITRFLLKNGLHFTSSSTRDKKLLTKICVNCGEEFLVSANNKKHAEQLTCSQYCSSNYLPFKIKRVVAKVGGLASSYPLVAKRNNLTYCCICNEKEVVDIHHLDEDRTNNDISNLVPLCPTHHAYMHRGKSNLILSKLVEYLDTRVTVD